jgi:hypothetical protein
MKKTEGRKSRDTVPLRAVQHLREGEEAAYKPRCNSLELSGRFNRHRKSTRASFVLFLVLRPYIFTATPAVAAAMTLVSASNGKYFLHCKNPS